MSEPHTVVLVVEDEPPMRRFLHASLGYRGYHVLEAANAAEAMLVASSEDPDIILLDLGLPDADGIDLTRRLREWSKTPIIVISARGCEGDKVAALDAGADDYLTKPFGLNELLARMRVALRHGEGARGEAASRAFVFEDLTIDPARREVMSAGVEVHLTPIEYRILLLLAENAGKLVTHAQILRHVWGAAFTEHLHYVRVHVAQLRKKIERDPARPKLLLNEPGVGYRLRDRS